MLQHILCNSLLSKKKTSPDYILGEVFYIEQLIFERFLPAHGVLALRIHTGFKDHKLCPIIFFDISRKTRNEEILVKKYEYKFVEVTVKSGLKTKGGDAFDECKKIILQEAENGWRLNQVVAPFNEKMGMYAATGYQIIFERVAE